MTGDHSELISQNRGDTHTQKRKSQGGKERAGVCECGSFASEEVGVGKKNAYKGDQVKQEIFHEIFKRRCLRLLLRGDVRRIPLTFSLRALVSLPRRSASRGDRPAKGRRTYPYHEDRFPDVTHAVVDQTGRINELVLLEGLWGVCAQRLDRHFHLFGKAGHHCKLRQRENRQWELWRSWMCWSAGLSPPNMGAILRDRIAAKTSIVFTL